jgi:hydroxymethylglutaryl-CoA lyase
MDIETGIDLQQLVVAAQYLETVIGRTLPGQIMKAGAWDRRYQLPHVVEERLAALAQ